jgi:predicted transcriptional regulator
MLAPATRVGRNFVKTAKEQAIDSISGLPANATWQDILYRLYVRRKIEEGIKAAQEGRLVSHDEVKKLFAERQ